MTERSLGGTPPPPSASGPTAQLSASALLANLPAASRAAGSLEVGALAFDAWGHGLDWVRVLLEGAGVPAAEASRLPGPLLYGLTPAEDVRPVMRLSGRILATKALRAGEGVSYGFTHRATSDTRVALVTGGYAQGVVRGLGDRAELLVGGARRRIVGRVAMDVCVVDIADADIERGDEAVFFGDGVRGEPTVAEWSALLGWSAAEIVSAVGRRTVRRERA